MKKYEDGKYIELSAEEIKLIEQEEKEYLSNATYDEDENNTANAIKEKVTGKVIVIKDVSPLEDSLTVKMQSPSPESGILYEMGQNVWDEICTYDNNSLNLISDYIHVIPGTDYYFYSNSPVMPSEMMEVPLFCRIRYYDISQQELSVSDETPTSAKRNTKLTIPPECYYIKFNLYETYGSIYNNDICINVYDERINGTYVPYQGEEAYFYNTNRSSTITKPSHSVMTLFTEEESVVLECEYNKDTKGAINEAMFDAKEKWELISSGELTEEVSLIALSGFSCSKVALSIAVQGTTNNASEDALTFRTNMNSNEYGGANNSLTRIFRNNATSTITVNGILEMQNKWIAGHLFGAGGIISEYLNTTKYDSITGLYLQPKTAGIVFGAGTTYELWGVRK